MFRMLGPNLPHVYSNENPMKNSITCLNQHIQASNLPYIASIFHALLFEAPPAGCLRERWPPQPPFLNRPCINASTKTDQNG